MHVACMSKRKLFAYGIDVSTQIDAAAPEFTLSCTTWSNSLASVSASYYAIPARFEYDSLVNGFCRMRNFLPRFRPSIS
jgi:hypothetical protein